MGSRLKKSLSRGLLFLGMMLMASSFAGCGSSSSDGGGEAAVQTGTFVDSIVVGLNFKTPTGSGLTDEKGTFEYKTGEVVQFFIGDIFIGQASGKKVLTPVDLVAGAQDETHPQVINLIRFLQTLDEDNNPENGIVIAALVRDASAGRSINFSLSVSEFGSDENITLLISELTESLNVARGLVASLVAQTHFRGSLLELFEGFYQGQFSGTDSGTWEFRVSNRGIISGQFTSSDGSSDTISGNVGSNGETTISGIAGSSVFLGMFQTSGSVTGTWENTSGDSGTFSGERVVPSEPEGETEATGSLSLSGADTVILGTSFTPKGEASVDIDDTAGLVQWTAFGNLLLDQVAKELLVSVRFSGDGTPTEIAVGVGTLDIIGSVSVPRVYGYLLNCSAFGVDCSGVSVDISAKKITFSNVTIPEASAALNNNPTTAPIKLDGQLGW